MRYVAYQEMSPPFGAIQVKRFRANSVFDPDQTGVGHQPLGFDEACLWYNHYRVLGAKIKVTVLNGSTVAANACTVAGIYLSDDTTIPLTWEHLAELGRGVQRTLTTSNSGRASMTMGFSTRKFFGPNVDKGETSALVTTSPTEEAYFNVYAQAMDSATTLGVNLQFKVEIDYTVDFFEPKDIGQS